MAGQLFAVPRRHERLQWEMLVPEGQVWERVLSKSYVASLPASQGHRLKADIDRVMASVVEEPSGVRYPHYTDVFWTYRRAV